MGGFKDLFASERGTLAIVIIIAATVLLALDKLSSVEWLAITGGTGGALITSKTVTGVAEIRSAQPPAPAAPSGQTVNVNTGDGAA